MVQRRNRKKFLGIDDSKLMPPDPLTAEELEEYREEERKKRKKRLEELGKKFKGLAKKPKKGGK